MASCAQPTFSPFNISLQLNSKSSVKQVAPHPNFLRVAVSITNPVPPIWADSPILLLANWSILLADVNAMA